MKMNTKYNKKIAIFYSIIIDYRKSKLYVNHFTKMKSKKLLYSSSRQILIDEILIKDL